ncbi:hypothetical protein [Brachybacterium sacelli]|uniref:hypothetical protein n=1 Tax=Brachybacterium sacelli TaxID=173364 RepID=UPI0036092045
MAPKVRSRASSWWWAELPVAGLLLASVLVVGLSALHLVMGGCWAGATIWHLATRNRPLRRRPTIRARRDIWRRMSTVLAAVVLLLALGTVVSGVARGLGVPADRAWHGGLSWMLLAATIGHVLMVKVVPRVKRSARATRTSSDRAD